MDYFFNILRKFLVGVTTLVFAFVVLYVPQHYNQPKQAEAQLAVFDAAAVAALGVIAGTVATSEARESVLDGIAYHIAKAFLSQILQSTIDWINNGFRGSPAFIQDLERFLLDTADIAAGEYIRSLGELGSIICRPFRIDIQLALSLKYQKARGGGSEVDECTLSGIVDNIEDFIDGTVAREDFWEQWIEVTSKPRTYTPYGQLLEAEAQMGVYINGKEVIASKELDWGSGFLSSKVCESVAGPNGPTQSCVITTPGETIAASLNKALGAGQDQLVAADEINEVISALVGQIANQALTGAAGLLGLSVRGGGGGNGGSLVNSLVEESQASSGMYFNQGIEEVANRLDIQIEYRNLAIQYIPQLLAASNDRSATSEERARAQLSYGDAVMVRDTTAEHIAVLQPLVDRYRTLETEYASATSERRQAIRQEQSTIITRGIQYSSYTRDRMRLSNREWADIVR